jgi:uroporphyrin-III C-methyltransferase
VLALAVNARIVDVGKRRGKRSAAQDDIHARLLAEAKAGRFVVRLKGGDPFVFGRGGEEAQFLAERGVDVEVVPGLSSALAVPAVHNVPVTHRGVAQAFTVLTGTAASSSTDLESQWVAAAKVGGTLVFLMAVHALDRVVAACGQGGLPSSTPVAIVVDGTQAGERIVVSTLGDVVQDAAREQVRAPAVIVVGEVVRVRAALAAAGAAHVRV